jgi:predicted HTH transcriptional regulator
MNKKWDQAAIQLYIDDGIQESLSLEYKAADALGKSDGKKKEITKDVSAMANSAGGVIIYGVAEYQDSAKQHLPEKIDPVNQTEFSKEWLQQVINTIRPRVDGIAITSVPIANTLTDVVYVVEIPQSTTAHQATDWRYYKRYNFLSIPMEDYEIRDVMGRQQHPKN